MYNIFTSTGWFCRSLLPPFFNASGCFSPCCCRISVQQRTQDLSILWWLHSGGIGLENSPRPHPRFGFSWLATCNLKFYMESTVFIDWWKLMERFTCWRHLTICARSIWWNILPNYTAPPFYNVTLQSFFIKIARRPLMPYYIWLPHCKAKSPQYSYQRSKISFTKKFQPPHQLRSLRPRKVAFVHHRDPMDPHGVKGNHVSHVNPRSRSFLFLLNRHQFEWIWGFPSMGVPPNGWFIREHPIKMDDVGVPLWLRKPPYVARHGLGSD